MELREGTFTNSGHDRLEINILFGSSLENVQIELELTSTFRGLAKARDHLPHAGTIIASSFTSPLDPLYLAGIFAPIFTRSYPGTRKVEPISLFRAILLAFS